MDDLQARKNALLAQLATADEPPPLLHPSMGDPYRSKAEELASGANNVTGATTRALELLFGDKYDFVVTSLIAGTTPIQYHRFSEMADDVVDVRVYQGISAERT